ncbi:pyridoxamine 5'-phosphate oxidase family protein [Nocardia sp. NPDC050713]|uniref:pyridoxamine 5'-phosphate oxidase family protein n=1 Tax=Nocardia sp. NPDC050713 TaxID=3154511 RepID=UPI0033DC8514
MAFTEQEITYLRAQPLARLATVDPDGQPDVVPVAIEVENPGLWICGAGEQVLRKKPTGFMNISPESCLTCSASRVDHEGVG